ncbi:MAG: hypothetical protein AB9873_14965 [Syntrophobacteraceae bacterium]
MGFVLYPGRVPETAAGVVSIFGKHRWSGHVEVCPSLENLVDRLLQIPILCEVVVAVADREELEKLATTWKRLLPPKLILILRRWEDEIVKAAFELYPSFLTSLENGLTDVCLVLERIEAKRCGMGSNETASSAEAGASNLETGRPPRRT